MKYASLSAISVSYLNEKSYLQSQSQAANVYESNMTTVHCVNYELAKISQNHRN